MLWLHTQAQLLQDPWLDHPPWTSFRLSVGGSAGSGLAGTTAPKVQVLMSAKEKGGARDAHHILHGIVLMCVRVFVCMHTQTGSNCLLRDGTASGHENVNTWCTRLS